MNLGINLLVAEDDPNLGTISFEKFCPTWAEFPPTSQIRCRVTSQPSFPGNRKRAKMNFIMKPSQPAPVRIVRSILRTFPQLMYSVVSCASLLSIPSFI